MRIVAMHVFWFLAFLIGCSDSSTKEQSGVTSTGNAGDVAGYVVVQKEIGLGRVGVEGNLFPVDSALVEVFDQDGRFVDSTRTNREGAFRLKYLPQSIGEVVATFQGMRAALSIDGENRLDQVSRLELNVGAQWVNDTLPVSIYSAEPGPVWNSVSGSYSYFEGDAFITFYRTFNSDTITNAIWNLYFLDPEMILWNPNQTGCAQKSNFFSLAPQVVTGNNWFYNGDLAEDFALGNTVCSQSLTGLPEMNRFGMSGLEMQFKENGRFKGVFYGRDYCLTNRVSMEDLYGEYLPSDSRLEIRDCNSFLVLQENSDTTVVRLLWLDMAAEWGEEEISHGDHSWVRKGTWKNFTLNEPR